MSAAVPVAELTDIQKRYPGPPEFDALKECRMQVSAGEYVSIMGPSGSGKSTLLNILGLLDTPTSGTYVLDGEPVEQMTEKQRSGIRAHKIGFVFQSFYLMPRRSALDNASFGLLHRGTVRKERQERAEEALRQVGLGHKLGSMPSTLSGGERQRVAIARAIVGRPQLLLCDEPTGNLDVRSAEVVLNVLSDLHQSGMTIVMITHDADVAGRAERMVRIVDGILT